MLSANWVAWLPPSEEGSKKKTGRQGNGNGKGGDEESDDFDVVLQAIAPAPVLDKPGKGQKGANGQTVEGEEGEEVPEKTFLQK